MEALAPGQVRFRIHGPDTHDDDEMVSASLFANKLASLVRALKAADAAVNGVKAHDYVIAKLSSSAPTVVLSEQITDAQSTGRPISSGVSGMEACAAAAIAGERDVALSYGKCLDYLQALSGGASKTYGYGEVWTANDNIIRIDPFLLERTKSIVAPVEPASAQRQWYKGVVHASFDGTVQATDWRGALPELKLTLTAGGKELDCVCREDHIELVRQSLQRRVRVYGRAIYDGKTGLPRRVEISDIQMIGEPTDFTVWRGAMPNAEIADWDLDIDE